MGSRHTLPQRDGERQHFFLPAQSVSSLHRGGHFTSGTRPARERMGNAGHLPGLFAGEKRRNGGDTKILMQFSALPKNVVKCVS